jgi:hypothetical protein
VIDGIGIVSNGVVVHIRHHLQHGLLCLGRVHGHVSKTSSIINAWTHPTLPTFHKDDGDELLIVVSSPKLQLGFLDWSKIASCAKRGKRNKRNGNRFQRLFPGGRNSCRPLSVPSSCRPLSVPFMARRLCG